MTAEKKRSRRKLLKVRRATFKMSGRKNKNESFCLTLPTEIAREMPDGIQFTCELTEGGILYRPYKAPAEPTKPSWLEDK